MLKKTYYFLKKERNFRNIWKKNRNKKGIIISYHYVNDRVDDFWKNMKGLKNRQFINQIKYFKEQNYNFISLDDYINFLYGKNEIPNNFCVRTFDDGLREHYDNVFPILKEFGIVGHFFPLPKTVDGIVLPVHKTHILLAKLGSEKFANEVNLSLKKIAPDKYEKFKIDDRRKTNLDRQKRIEEKYQMDGIKRTNLKYNLAIMDAGLKNGILNNIFNRYFDDEKKIAEEFYLNKKQIQDMSQNNMCFGAHTLTHPRLAMLDKKEQRNEIMASKLSLENITNKETNTFSYPYGSYDENVFRNLKELGFNGAVTIKAQHNIGLVNPYIIRRFDSKDFPQD